MNVWIKVLDLPELMPILGKREFLFSFSGQTLQDLLQSLVDRFGPELGRILLDTEGRLDPSIRVIVNGKLCGGEERPVPLEENNRIVLVAFLEGG